MNGGIDYDPNVQTALQDAIGRLPGTPDEIAATLAARGITGRRRKATSCVIANYLRAELGELVHRGTVTAGTVTAGVLIGGRAVASVDLPYPVGSFIGQFDSGQYEALDSENVGAVL